MTVKRALRLVKENLDVTQSRGYKDHALYMFQACYTVTWFFTWHLDKHLKIAHGTLTNGWLIWFRRDCWSSRDYETSFIVQDFLFKFIILISFYNSFIKVVLLEQTKFLVYFVDHKLWCFDIDTRSKSQSSVQTDLGPHSAPVTVSHPTHNTRSQFYRLVRLRL